MIIVLAKEDEKFEDEFHRACRAARVVPYLTADAADGFSEYQLTGATVEARLKIAQTYAKHCPGGPWAFASPFARICYGWESPKAEEKTGGTCALTAHVYKKLPGGHEHEGSRLYDTPADALIALKQALKG